MTRFLITGVNGFVAQYFLEYLEKHNNAAEVLGLDIGPTCVYRSTLPLSYRQVDLTEGDTIRKILADFRPHYILHLAAISSVAQSWLTPLPTFLNNTNIFLNLAEAVRELKLPTRILSVGSSEEYGNYSEADMPLREDHILHPANPYAVARVSQELLSQLYSQQYGLDIVMTRSFNHIGPRQRDVFVVASFVKQLVENSGKSSHTLKVGNVEIVRDFLDVRDVVDAYYKILTSGRNGEIYNVCSGKGVRLREIIDLIAAQLSLRVVIEVDPARIRPADNMVIIGDNTKLRESLGWTPVYSLENTLQDMICYWCPTQT